MKYINQMRLYVPKPYRCSNTKLENVKGRTGLDT